MNQIGQFICWLGRDFLSLFNGLTPSKIFTLLLGAQLGTILIATITRDLALQEFLLYSVPATLLVMVLCLFIEVQWDRFKRDQERVIKNLK